MDLNEAISAEQRGRAEDFVAASGLTITFSSEIIRFYPDKLTDADVRLVLKIEAYKKALWRAKRDHNLATLSIAATD